MRWIRYAAAALVLLLLGALVRLALAPPDAGTDTDRTTAPHARDAESADAADDPAAAVRATRRHHLPPRGQSPSDAADTVADRVDERITGRVARDSGDGIEPYAGATVRLYRDDPLDDDQSDAVSTEVSAPIVERTTDADGRFELRPDVPGAWRLVVSTAEGLGTHARGRGWEDAGELILSELGHASITVLDGEEQPITGAFAYVYAATFDVLPFGLVEATTGGKIVLDPAPGAALVTAPGHGFARVPNPSGAERVVLPRGLDLGGRVVDDTGTPLVGVRVFVDDDGPTRVARSAEDGAFLFERLGEQDDVFVTVDVGRHSVTRTIGYGETSAEIVIPRRGDIAGVVVYSDGTPAAGALVEGREVDENGRFVLWTDGHDRATTLVAQVPGRLPGFGGKVPLHTATKRVELHPGETTDVRLVVQRSPHSFIHVRAIEPGGSVSPDPYVHVSGVWLQRQRIHESVLLAVGTEPGTTMNVIVYDHARRHLPRRTQIVTTAAPDVGPTDVHLDAAEPVTLRVLDTDGSPVPRPEWKKVHVEPGKVLDDGRIVAVPGAYVRVVVEARGRRVDGRYRLPTQAGHELSIRLAGSSRVTGRLLRADGSPARDVDVVVAPFSAFATGAYLRARPARDGTFVVEDVPGGRALFVVWQSDGEVQAQRNVIEVPDDGELDLGTMLAWDDVVLEGRVTAPNGVSVAGLAVEVWWDEGRETAHALSRADGSFRMRVPGVPNAVLTASRRGTLFGVTGVNLSSTRRADVRVQEIGTIRVHMGEDWAATPFDIFMATPDGSATWATSCEWIERGRIIVVEEAPAGTWLLRAVRGDEVVERRVHVVPGEETRVQLAR